MKMFIILSNSIFEPKKSKRELDWDSSDKPEPKPVYIVAEDA